MKIYKNKTVQSCWIYVSFLFFLTIATNANALIFNENDLDTQAINLFGITDPVNIYYEIYNPTASGYPLFLLHGGFVDSQYWFNAREELSKTYKVIAVDSRGHGNSGYGTEKISYELMTNDLRALIYKLGYGPNNKVNIVGWSDGGITAINLCITYGNVVNKAIFFGVNVTSNGLVTPNLLNNANTFRNLFGCYTSESFIGDMLDMWMSDSYITNSSRPFYELRRITAKTAVFAARLTRWSPGDTTVKISHMRQIANSINANKTVNSDNWCEFTELLGLTHNSPSNGETCIDTERKPNTEEHPEQANAFNKAVLKFLE